MLSRSIRTLLPVLGGAFLLAAPHADAQVTLNLTTPQATSCVAVTDAQGLQLVPGSTDLQATGVTLTGTGCGGGDSEFDADVIVPASAVAGTAFNVTWSASEAATRCTFGGTSGITNWPVGQEACSSSAACSTPNPHVRSVTVPSAGSYAFNVTCTNATGFDQGSVTATAPPLPPQPANFALTAPATATIGTPIQVSWSVTGAASCSGGASLNGSSVDLPGWTSGTTSPTPPRSITFTQAGAYTLTLTCSNSAGNTPSQPKSVTVSGDSGSCPAGRQTVANVCYSYGDPPANCSNNADVTRFENLWGRGGPSDPPIVFPGKNVFAIVKNMQKTQYLALKFTAPTTPLNQHGTMYTTESQAGPTSDFAISTECGDFAPADSRCRVLNVPRGGAAGAWKMPGYAGPALCPLVPGEEYYLNVRINDPATTHDECSGTTCWLGVVNYHQP